MYERSVELCKHLERRPSSRMEEGGGRVALSLPPPLSPHPLCWKPVFELTGLSLSVDFGEDVEGSDEEADVWGGVGL